MSRELGRSEILFTLQLRAKTIVWLGITSWWDAAGAGEMLEKQATKAQ